MACPNFKKGLKMVSRPLGIKILQLRPQVLILFLVEKWIPPSRLETTEIGQKNKGILGVKPLI
jgi:hypothetical protein